MAPLKISPAKKAVLVGLKYRQPQMNDGIDLKRQLLRMKKHLMEVCGFSENNITLMIEDDEEEEDQELLRPDDYNISRELCRLIYHAKPGHILFIHLIGHGCSDGFVLAADKTHTEDHLLRGLIVHAVNKGCNLTFVSDCLIEHAPECPECPECRCPEIQRTPLTTEQRLELRKKLMELMEKERAGPFRARHPGEEKVLTPTNLTHVDILNPNLNEEKNDEDDSSRVILLTPFQRDHTVPILNPDNVSELFLTPPKNTSYPYGGFTNAILDVIEETHGSRVTNLELARKAMDKLGQIPSLRCHHHHHAYASFVC